MKNIAWIWVGTIHLNGRDLIVSLNVIRTILSALLNYFRTRYDLSAMDASLQFQERC